MQSFFVATAILAIIKQIIFSQIKQIKQRNSRQNDKLIFDLPGLTYVVIELNFRQPFWQKNLFICTSTCCLCWNISTIILFRPWVRINLKSLSHNIFLIFAVQLYTVQNTKEVFVKKELKNIMTDFFVIS